MYQHGKRGEEIGGADRVDPDAMRTYIVRHPNS